MQHRVVAAPISCCHVGTGPREQQLNESCIREHDERQGYDERTAPYLGPMRDHRSGVGRRRRASRPGSSSAGSVVLRHD